MRRRSVSIYADSLEDYLENVEKADNFLNKRTHTINNQITHDEKQSDDEDSDNDLLRNNLKNKSLFYKLDSKNEETEEIELYQQLQSLNNVYKSKNEKENFDKSSSENGVNLLCSYFKENILNTQEQECDSDLVIFSAMKKPLPVLRSMSNNAIYDIDIKRALDNIIKENENEGENAQMKTKKPRNSIYSSSSSSTKISKDILVQNVECQEEVMKIMLVGSTLTGKTKLINNFFEARKNKYIPSSGLEIKKKIVQILNKKVRVEFFDTNADFHLKEPSKIYYKICNSFIYIVDTIIADSFNFIKNIHSKILDNSHSTNFILILINNGNLTKDTEKEIQEYTKEYKITLFPVSNLDNFDMKIEAVSHLFSAMLIKNMKGRNKNRNYKFESKFSPNSVNDKPKCSSVEICIGFNTNYRIETYNEFN